MSPSSAASFHQTTPHMAAGAVPPAGGAVPGPTGAGRIVQLYAGSSMLYSQETPFPWEIIGRPAANGIPATALTMHRAN
jgi:hypothetical protein